MSNAYALYGLFKDKTKELFHFLIDSYDCDLVTITESVYSCTVTYKNATTGVKISLEPRENDIFVNLIRLVHGEIPEYLDAPSNWQFLDGVLRLRAPGTKIERKAFGDWLTPADVVSFLEQYANALRTYADDILRGDFSVFVELEEMYRQRH